MKITKLTNFFGVTRAETTEKVVALTFDDGPLPPYTNQILDVLEKYQSQATFFAIGKSIEKYPELVRMIVEKGSEMGNHSYSHQSMWFKPNEFLKLEIAKTDAILYQLGATGTIHFRPPWGRRLFGLPLLISQMQKKLIMWDIDSKDYFDELSAEEIANHVIQSIRPGAIVVMHDGGGDRSRTVQATEVIIKTLQDKGYSFQTVSQVLSREK